MRDGFACQLAHVQNLAAAGSGKQRRGGQAELPVILFVIENFVSVDMPVNSEMGISQRFFSPRSRMASRSARELCCSRVASVLVGVRLQ